MKDRVIFTIIGIIIGSLVVTGFFYVYNKKNHNESVGDVEINNNDRSQMPGGMRPPKMPSEDGEEFSPPEMPGGDLPDRRDYTQGNIS